MGATPEGALERIKQYQKEISEVSGGSSSMSESQSDEAILALVKGIFDELSANNTLMAGTSSHPHIDI